MRLSSIILPVSVLLIAAAASIATAIKAVDVIEERSESAVKTALILSGDEWATVAVDGLQVILNGTALSESDRFRALNAASSVVDAARVIDRMEVADSANVPPPRFSIEILRDETGISLIGLVPESTRRDVIAQDIAALAQGAEVTDMLDTAAYPPPEGWEQALAFGVEALKRLPKSKISIAADRVSVTATAESTTQKRRLEESLAERAPDGMELALRITAPRPVITPFTLRFLIDEKGPRFDACAADSEEARRLILDAARQAGFSGGGNCTIGLGAPSPRWGEAVAAGIRALHELGGGSLTFSDADVSLVAPAETPRAHLDEVAARLETALPAVFSLHAILPEPVNVDGSGKDSGEGPPEFVATRSPEGLVQLRGRLTDERLRAVVNSYAQARFGADNIDSAMRLDPELPEGWSLRVLAGLEALSRLASGSIVIQPDFAQLRGKTGNPDAKAEISRILSEKLGAGANFTIDVTYEKRLDPVANLPTPEECVASINAVLKENKITFAPGSATIEPTANRTLDKIAGLLKNCEDVQMEIAGHTDSQGREEMNLNLSQARAEAVLTALMARRVLTSGLVAKGYGEARPIADNKTEEGREANRRIEFTLIAPKGEDAAADGTGNGSDGENGSTGSEKEETAVSASPSSQPAEQSSPPAGEDRNGTMPVSSLPPKPRPETSDEQN